MRIVTYGGAVSLDGFITGPAGAMDWLHMSPDVGKIMEDYWKTVDAVLMGRKTYEVAAAAGGAGGETAGVASYVFSRTLPPGSIPGATIVADDAGEFVRRLKREKGKGICLMGGGELAQSLFAAGVIDEVGLNIHPVLLGSGTPAFRDPGHRVNLELTEARPLEGGCILASYRVKRSAKR